MRGPDIVLSIITGSIIAMLSVVLTVVFSIQYDVGFHTAAIENIQQDIIDLKNHFNVISVDYET